MRIPNLKLIVALDEKCGIGINNKLPWPHIPTDMKFFKNVTNNCAVIMGKNTFESIPVQLKNRKVFVVSTTLKESKYDNVHICSSFEHAVELAKTVSEVLPIYVVGGRSIYLKALPLVSSLLITHVKSVYETDVQIPEIYNLIESNQVLSSVELLPLTQDEISGIWLRITEYIMR